MRLPDGRHGEALKCGPSTSCSDQERRSSIHADIQLDGDGPKTNPTCSCEARQESCQVKRPMCSQHDKHSRSLPSGFDAKPGRLISMLRSLRCSLKLPD